MTMKSFQSTSKVFLTSLFHANSASWAEFRTLLFQSGSSASPDSLQKTSVLSFCYTRSSKSHKTAPKPPGVKPQSPGLTLFMYSLSRSWSACRTALHSATILSRRSSRVQDESAMSAAPLMMLSSLSSRDGRNLASLNVMGSRIILFWKQQHERISGEETTAFAPCCLNQKYLRQDSP